MKLYEKSPKRKAGRLPCRFADTDKCFTNDQTYQQKPNDNSVSYGYSNQIC